MTNDQFETLAQMIKSVHDDPTEFQSASLRHSQEIFAHQKSHDDRLRMINKEMLDQGKRLRKPEGFAPEVVDHSRRLKHIERKLDLPRPALK